MPGLNKKLKGFKRANPFREAQSRNYGIDKIVEEFYPTSFYWSLFNETHEILLGTRGSGKTILLKMLTYSCLRKFGNTEAKKYLKKFVGFYIPLHLEFMAAMPGVEIQKKYRKEYFQFAFNCFAVKSFLSEVENLLEDCFRDEDERINVHFALVKKLVEMWFPSKLKEITSLNALKWKVELLYNSEVGSLNKKLEGVKSFCKPILMPIVAVLDQVNILLGLDPDNFNWIACIDEAEFLEEPFIECINTFLRSDKKRISVKMATMPFKHITLKTNMKDVEIEPEGNDFNYRMLDLAWDDHDFVELTNKICKKRISKCVDSLNENDLTLESFLGVVGNDDFIDYYKFNIKQEESTKQAIYRGIVDVLSHKRQKTYQEKHSSPTVKKEFYDRFAPVFFTRKMKSLNSKGNKIVAWFSGAKNIRRVADGNPRRFIQLMNYIIEEARIHELTPLRQHRVVMDFCCKYHEFTAGLPEYGYLIVKLMELIGENLSKRVHGQEMLDTGCRFNIGKDIIDDELWRGAIEVSIAYSLVITDENTLFFRLHEKSELRLSFLYCVKYWLPMRKGPMILVKREQNKLFDSVEKAPITEKAAKSIMEQYKFDFQDRGD